MRFEITTTEFRSATLTVWTIRPWVQLALRDYFVHLIQFHCLFSVKFHSGYCLRHSPRVFWLKIFLRLSHECRRMNDTYGIHHWRILWSSYRKLTWVGFETTTIEFRSDALTSQFCTATPIWSFAWCQVSFRLLLSTVVTFIFI